MTKGFKLYDSAGKTILSESQRLPSSVYFEEFSGVDLDITKDLTQYLPNTENGVKLNYFSALTIDEIAFEYKYVGKPAYETPLIFEFNYPVLRLRWKYVHVSGADYTGQLGYIFKGSVEIFSV